MGGAEISTHTLLSYLVSRGHQCLALGTLGKYLDDIKMRKEQFDKHSIPYRFTTRTLMVGKYKIPIEFYLSLNIGYNIKLTLLYNYVKFFLEHASKYKPDLVITQMMGSGLAVSFSYESKIPCAHLIRDLDTLYNLEPLFLEHRYIGYADFFSNSKFVRKEFKKRYKKDTGVLYPSIKISDYKLNSNKGKYITFINPNAKKGIDIFLQVANQLPTYRFMVVEGWEKIPGSSPLRKLKNVTVRSRQFDMKIIYQETKLLLVPSVWKEAFARVVVEAQAGGVPVLAGRHSGLIESVGNGGILLRDYLEVTVWTQAIESLFGNKNLYKALSIKARENASRFDVEKTAIGFCKKYDL